jgi:hypothetical protein
VIASAADPQQHGAYHYARGNPMRFTDPTGMYVSGEMDWGIAFNNGGRMSPRMLDNWSAGRFDFRSDWRSLGVPASAYFGETFGGMPLVGGPNYDTPDAGYGGGLNFLGGVAGVGEVGISGDGAGSQGGGGFSGFLGAVGNLALGALGFAWNAIAWVAADPQRLALRGSHRVPLGQRRACCARFGDRRRWTHRRDDRQYIDPHEGLG